MSLSTPTKITVPFANSGSKNAIPTPSQIGITPGAASYTDGFPPLTMTPVASGGVPPFGQDFNGIFYELSAAIQYSQAGGTFVYDSAFATAIGGYPLGAILQASGGTSLWLNTVANNTSNPDTGGANWSNIGLPIASAAQAQGLTDNASIITPLALNNALKGSNQLLALPGYQKFPGGLIKQWGRTITLSESSVTITLPVTFPTAALSATATPHIAASVAGAVTSAYAYIVSASQLTISLDIYTGGSGPVNWECWGY